MDETLMTYFVIQNYEDNLFITTKGFDISYTSNVENAIKFNSIKELRSFVGMNLDSEYKFRIIKVHVKDTLINLNTVKN